MIDIINLHKSFNENYVLRGVDLHVESGETMVVIGGSGSGKSVLIKHVIGLLTPDDGSVLIDGVNISHLDERNRNELRKKFGMLFQGAALFDSLTVWENVAFGLMQHTDLSKREIRDIASQKLEIVGLRGIEDLMPAELSGGMKKRVGLARAVALEPEILLYDEPTTGLDPIMADVINNLLVEMKKKLKVTAIAITHDMVSAYKIGDEIAMLYEGRILEVETPAKIKMSLNPAVKQFITGSSAGPIRAV